jgi:hypothetical protein
MRPAVFPLIFISALNLAGCATPPNVKPPNSHNAPPPPQIKNTYYDPYAAYGSANATWVPPVIDRQGTIVKPTDPSTQGANRPDYEHAQWASGAHGGDHLHPPGTF